MKDGILILAGIALTAGAVVSPAAPAKADHCYLLNSGMIYCYDSLPGHVVHQMWPTGNVPPLTASQRWECNLMAHPRTICVSYELGSAPPEIPKYTPGSREFDAAATRVRPAEPVLVSPAAAPAPAAASAPPIKKK